MSSHASTTDQHGLELRFEPLAPVEDTGALIDFLTRQAWPFHVGSSLTRADVQKRITGGGFHDATTRTFWALEGAERVALVRLEDVGDGDPLFDLRVDQDHRGRGIGTEAVRWLTRYLFDELPQAGRIEAQTRRDNSAMRAVLDRCGYVKEAHYRRAWPGPGGHLHDGIGYAVLREDWVSGEVTPVQWDS